MFRVSAVDISDRGNRMRLEERRQKPISLLRILETCVKDREEVLVSGTVWKKEFTENRQAYYLTNVSIHIHGRSLRESKIILYRKTNSKKQTENEIFCGNKVKVTGKLRYFDRARNPGISIREPITGDRRSMHPYG